MKNREYTEIKLLKKSEKSEICLVCSEGEKYIRKVLAGQHPVYNILKDNPHPGIPRLLDVSISEDSTTVLEEYIPGQSIGELELSKKQFSTIVGELCSVLTFLHGIGIIHRDIKPSNVLLTESGHVRLIDFDIARTPKGEQKQDTQQLGTRTFAPPEQYGFAQTDERADIYALGVTLDLLLTEKNRKPHYKRVIQKCMNLDPDKRYSSVEQFRRAFFPFRRNLLQGCIAVCLLAFIALGAWKMSALWKTDSSETGSGNGTLTVLPMPEDVHWRGETATMEWNNVPESGVVDEVQFRMRLYRLNTNAAPDPENDDWYYEDLIRIGGKNHDAEVLSYSVANNLQGNGFYYFTIAAAGDGIRYADSPYACSDIFAYTGEAAPPLPTPEGLAWKLAEKDGQRNYYATWSNLDDYEDEDTFNITVYDETGAYVMNNTWPLDRIREFGYSGILVRAQFLTDGPGRRYRFTVQAYSSRPNEYSSSVLPDPVPEEYYSSWLIMGEPEKTEEESTTP